MKITRRQLKRLLSEAHSDYSSRSIRNRFKSIDAGHGFRVVGGLFHVPAFGYGRMMVIVEYNLPDDTIERSAFYATSGTSSVGQANFDKDSPGRFYPTGGISENPDHNIIKDQVTRKRPRPGTKADQISRGLVKMFPNADQLRKENDQIFKKEIRARKKGKSAKERSSIENHLYNQARMNANQQIAQLGAMRDEHKEDWEPPHYHGNQLISFFENQI